MIPLPCFWASAITWSASVVFPEASCPKISTTLPCLHKHKLAYMLINRKMLSFFTKIRWYAYLLIGYGMLVFLVLSKMCWFTLGRPPTPKAMSRLREPVGTTSTYLLFSRPSHMTVSLPCFLEIWSMAAWMSFCFRCSWSKSGLSASIDSVVFLARLPASHKFLNLSITAFHPSPLKTSNPHSYVR